jgi:hypothetical protein
VWWSMPGLSLEGTSKVRGLVGKKEHPGADGQGACWWWWVTSGTNTSRKHPRWCAVGPCPDSTSWPTATAAWSLGTGMLSLCSSRRYACSSELNDGGSAWATPVPSTSMASVNTVPTAVFMMTRHARRHMSSPSASDRADPISSQARASPKGTTNNRHFPGPPPARTAAIAEGGPSGLTSSGPWLKVEEPYGAIVACHSTGLTGVLLGRFVQEIHRALRALGGGEILV